jgi:poly-gamma-glutamate synthase PgsB/CapB
MGLIYAALIGFALFLIAERVLLWYARKQFALVIHVNGTRGKSTVTRMIHAMLRQQGMEVFGKTTGSAARLLLPDGTEKPVLRFGPANIREQRNVMILSAFTKKYTSEKLQGRALVFECNAVQEELQYISMKWLKPDITVITNVREDHVQELGSAEQAARIFAAAVPQNAALVTSEGGFMNVWQAAAKQKNLQLRYVDPLEAGDCMFPENTACVLGIADWLNIARPDAVALIAGHKPDAGAFAFYAWKEGSRPVFFADARAANDIESTNRLSAAALQISKPYTGNANVKRILLLVNREDRPDRTELFLRYLIMQHKKLCFDSYLCLGHAPLSFRNTMKRKGIPHKFFQNIKDLEYALAQAPENTVYIFGVGNFGGKGKLVTQWLEAKRQASHFRVLS